MKTTYKYIWFLSTGKQRWDCLNRKHGEKLGDVNYNGRWRQYVYSPVNQAIYSAGCMRDVAEFLDACQLAEKE